MWLATDFWSFKYFHWLFIFTVFMTFNILLFGFLFIKRRVIFFCLFEGFGKLCKNKIIKTKFVQIYVKYKNIYEE